MTAQVPPGVAVPEPAISTTARDWSSLDKRWAASQAKGAEHDRAARRKVMIAAPVVIVVAALVIFALFRF